MFLFFNAVLEIENFLDEEECGLFIDIAKNKKMKVQSQQKTEIELKHPDQTFKEWDYNQDGFITPDEVKKVNFYLILCNAAKNDYWLKGCLMF